MQRTTEIFLNTANQIIQVLKTLQPHVDEARPILATLKSSVAKVETLYGLADSISASVVSAIVPVSGKLQDAVTAFLGKETADELVEMLQSATGDVFSELGDCEGDTEICRVMNSLPARRMLSRRILEAKEGDQMSGLSAKFKQLGDMVGNLAAKVVEFIMPFINALLQAQDKVNDFINGTIGKYARMAEAQLPALNAKLTEFRFYLDLFTGVVRDVLSIAKEVFDTGQMDGPMGFVDDAINLTYEWLDKVLVWKEIGEQVIGMLANADTTVILELIGKVFEYFDLPGQAILEGMTKLSGTLNDLRKLMNDDSMSDNDRLMGIAKLFLVGLDNMVPGTEEKVMKAIQDAVDTVKNALEAAASALLPDGFVSNFLKIHRVLCGPQLQDLQLCIPIAANVEAGGVSMLFDVTTELMNITDYVVHTDDRMLQMKVVGKLVSTIIDTVTGSDSSSKLRMIDELTSPVIEGDLSDYVSRFVTGARLLATVVDEVFGTDQASAVVEVIADLVDKAKAFAAQALDTIGGLCNAVENGMTTGRCDAITERLGAGSTSVAVYVECANDIADVFKQRMESMKTGSGGINVDELLSVVMGMVEYVFGGSEVGEILGMVLDAAKLIREITKDGSTSKMPSKYQMIAGAKLMAMVVDTFLGGNDASRTLATVTDAMERAEKAAASALATVQKICVNVAVAVGGSSSECNDLLPAINATVEDYVAAAEKIAHLVKDGIQNLRSGGAVATGDELMTIVNLLIDTGLGDGSTVARDLFAAAVSGGVAPSLPAPLTAVLGKVAVSLGVDAAGLSSGSPDQVINVVLALRKRMGSLTMVTGSGATVSMGRRRLQSMEDMTPEQLLSLAKVAGSVFAAMESVVAGGNPVAAAGVLQMLELLDKGQKVVETVRQDVRPLLVAVHTSLEPDVS
jgi:hypothetical protein